MGNELSLADMVAGMPPHEPQRRSRRTTERRRKKRRRRTWAMILVALLVVGGAAGVAWVGFLRPLVDSLSAPRDYPGPGTGRREVTIPDGATGTMIGQVLQGNGVVLTVKGFVAAYGANPASSRIQPGTYALKLQMRSADAVTALLNDANRLVTRVTVKEGLRAAQVPALIAGQTKIPLADLQAALRSPAAVGLPAEARNDPEGWLFPATYDVQPTTTAQDLLGQMVKRTVDELDSLGVAPAQRQTVLTKASLVQAEAKLAPDFPKIARVFDNRLARGMRLQLDTTVHYATKNFTVATTIKDTQVNSPYNTYVVPGLPIGPIDNPGTTAIQAVLNPMPGPWLYFVATNPETGYTEYATTPAEFAVIKKKYDAWAKAHPGR
ncbi:MAG TPA: endolytic transglycosylase MltG [Kineosporiaceae bacterium]